MPLDIKCRDKRCFQIRPSGLGDAWEVVSLPASLTQEPETEVLARRVPKGLTTTLCDSYGDAIRHRDRLLMAATFTPIVESSDFGEIAGKALPSAQKIVDG